MDALDEFRVVEVQRLVCIFSRRKATGQLEDEMVEGAWLVAPLSSEVIFSVPSEDVWDHVVRGLGIDPATLIPTRGVH